MTNIVEFKADFPLGCTENLEEFMHVLQKLADERNSLSITVDVVSNGPALAVHEEIINMFHPSSYEVSDQSKQTQYSYRVITEYDVGEDDPPKSTFDVKVTLDMTDWNHVLAFVSLICFYINMLGHLTYNGGHPYLSVHPDCDEEVETDDK